MKPVPQIWVNKIGIYLFVSKKVAYKKPLNLSKWADISTDTKKSLEENRNSN